MYGGVGLFDFHLENFIAQLENLLAYSEAATMEGDWLRVTAYQTQVELGIGQCFFHVDYDKWYCLVTEGKTQHYGGTVSNMA